MKKLRIRHQIITLVALGLAVIITAAAQAANLSDKDKQFLSAYEKIRAGLAADDLSGAKAAAADPGTTGGDLAKSTSLEAARAAFEKLSAQAKQLAAGQSDYHVFHCPMLKKDWVQTSTTAANPYGGKGMLNCGEI